MKKLNLNKSNFSSAEVLSRTQLKKVMGGSGAVTTKTTYIVCFNKCMAGWDDKNHTQSQNSAKVTACDTSCGGSAT
ncbi:hypothetical protein ACFOG5_09975 [Pedobacter fastidiosus]|uniref:Natural product n=1 Tax=Pedobacter fastidiosus TaxID=2765361 RepID=A0ABR7KWN0_9SPHI|nr:hypothetical protein [Pedobacter fastidiosus]MBC6112435.1 hypothetical protein [Pedobacter fastidiosus]